MVNGLYIYVQLFNLEIQQDSHVGKIREPGTFHIPRILLEHSVPGNRYDRIQKLSQTNRVPEHGYTRLFGDTVLFGLLQQRFMSPGTECFHKDTGINKWLEYPQVHKHILKQFKHNKS